MQFGLFYEWPNPTLGTDWPIPVDFIRWYEWRVDRKYLLVSSIRPMRNSRTTGYLREARSD